MSNYKLKLLAEHNRRVRNSNISEYVIQLKREKQIVGTYPCWVNAQRETFNPKFVGSMV